MQTTPDADTGDGSAAVAVLDGPPPEEFIPAPATFTVDIDGRTVEVQFADTVERAQAILADLEHATAVAVDTETVILRDDEGKPLPRDLNVEADGDGPGPWRVLSVAARFADNSVRGYVIDTGYVPGDVLADRFAGIRPFAWNAPFDQLVTRRGGLRIPLWWDLMIAEAILRTGSGGGDGRKYASLAKTAKRYLGYDMDGKTSTRLDYRTVQERPVLSADEAVYAAVDAIATLLVGPEIGARLAEANLTDTFVRDANGEPFTAGMTTAGLPMNVAGYTRVVETARTAMHVAAEQIAVLTTGRELLDTLVAWAKSRGHLADDATTGDLAVAAGLDMLHTPAVFSAFLTDVYTQAEAARDRMGAALGRKPVADPFSDEPGDTFVPLPFDLANDVDIRKWISTTAPHFAACYVLAAREEGQLVDLLVTDSAEILAQAGRRRKLTKDHDLDEVLTALIAAAETGTVFDDGVVVVAHELVTYRRYARILTTYGHLRDSDEKAYLVPTWDLSSAPQTKAMFNRFYPAVVEEYMLTTTGKKRLFDVPDSVDADAMKMLGGDLAAALLEFRKQAKIVSTYGDEMLNLVNKVTGRIHARYNQSLTGTGRLSSYKPNAQNLSPLVKPFIQPPLVDGVVRRVLVCADLSQAELRFVADAAQDIEMLGAFRSGEDLHTRTASLMFGINLVLVKEHGSKPLRELVGIVEGIEKYTDPEQGGDPDLLASLFYKTQRQKAKRVAFGYAYGLKGASLARGLTVEGVPTTKEEADDLLKKFDEAYPQVAAWMAARVAFIANLSDRMRDLSQPSGVDFVKSWLLHNIHSKTHSAATGLTKTLGRTPTGVELAAKLKPAVTDRLTELEAGAAQLREELGEEAYDAEVAALVAERDRVAKLADWALSYDHAVVLADNGTPWSFESRTAGGRRRLFEVPTSLLVMAVVSHIARSRRDDLVVVRDAWVESWNSRKAADHAAAKELGKARGEYRPVVLTKKSGNRVDVLDGRELEKIFEDRPMRTDFVAFALSMLPGRRVEQVWRAAMADRIRAMGNQYRNHPIQGGVADAVMVAFGDIYLDLSQGYPTACGIQSVHDSIVVECDIEQAAEVRDLVVKRMQDALASFCPSVPCVADGDIQLTLKDDSIVDDEKLAELIETARAADAAAAAA